MKIQIADLFCGGGGETTGIVQAAQAAGLRIDLAAVNHWQIAVDTHRMNYPDARTYCQDIATLNPLDVFGVRDRVDLLWASPECTHHSMARGGRPRSDQGRASAWLVLKWLSELYVRRVILENVPEFLNWGPLGADGQPLKSRKGETFRAFVTALESLGYKVEWQLLCAADYGDPTTRRRLFIQAVRGGARILWPEPTHAQTPSLFTQKTWIPARDVIDWSIHGESIFNRRRALAPATLRRIEAGIRRYWGEWAEPFIVILRGTSTTRETLQPMPTITAGGGHVGIVQPFVMAIDNRGREKGYAHSIDDPLRSIVTKNRFGIVEPFMVPFYGERNGQNPRSHGIADPIPTIPASGDGKFGIIEPFILHQDAPGRPRMMNEPIPTVRAKNGHGVVEPFLIKYFGTAEGQSTKIPIGALTAKDHYALIEGQPISLDITFRMLQPHELAAAQGFPRGYRFAGTKTDQVRQIGNSVPVGTARALVLEALSA